MDSGRSLRVSTSQASLQRDIIGSFSRPNAIKHSGKSFFNLNSRAMLMRNWERLSVRFSNNDSKQLLTGRNNMMVANRWTRNQRNTDPLWVRARDKAGSTHWSTNLHSWTRSHVWARRKCCFLIIADWFTFQNSKTMMISTPSLHTFTKSEILL